VSRRRQRRVRIEGLTSCNNKLLRFSVCTVIASGLTHRQHSSEQYKLQRFNTRADPITISARDDHQDRIPMGPKDAVALLAEIPAISACRKDLLELYGHLKILLDRSPRQVAFHPQVCRYLVLLINLGSFPFVWHSESLFLPSLGSRSRPYGGCPAQHVFSL